MGKYSPLNIPRRIANVARDEAATFRSWKKTVDPRKINLFAGAAAVAPGFVASLVGSMMFFNSHTIASDCASQSTSTPSAYVAPNVCKAAFADKERSQELILGGTIAMGVPGIIAVWNDGRLAGKQRAAKNSGRSL